MSLRVFVSHRSADEEIASVIVQEIESWLNGNGEVYYSSRPGAGKPGASLNAVLEDKIRQADLFVLAFTTADEDWSWCMYELGLAMGQDTKATQVVVFNCTDQRPRVQAANLEVNARSAASIMNFVLPFHKEPEWLMLDSGARADAGPLLAGLDFISPDELRKRADDLQAKLDDVLPKSEPHTLDRLEHLDLSLERKYAQHVRSLRVRARDVEEQNPEEYERLRSEAQGILLEHAKLGNKHSDRSARRFGYQAFPPHLPLGELLKSWRTEFKKSYGVSPSKLQSAWQNDFLSDLSRATEGRPSEPSDVYMLSADKNDTLKVQPVVVRTNQRVDDGVDYLVYFFKVLVRDIQDKST
ncbi:MAG: TIR domain-containing protein [Pseudomonadota bacterium]